MPKLQHRHKWRLTGDYSGGAWMECACGETMEDADMERRINAVEAFPIQDALQVLWDLEHAAGIAIGDEYEALEDYIEELEP